MSKQRKPEQQTGPGTIAALVTPLLLPKERMHLRAFSRLDKSSLILLAAALASLMIGLKEAPQRGWASMLCLSLLIGSVAGIALLIRRLTKPRLLILYSLVL